MLPERDEATRPSDAEQRLASALAMIDELRHQRQQLEAQIEAQRLQIERAELERADLHRQLGGAQQQLGELLRVLAAASAERVPRADGRAERPTAALGTAERSTATTSTWQRWRAQRSGLGASLTVTGLAAGLAGVLLHLALRTQVIDTAVHLGYLIGLTGVLLFLIGLFIVF